MSSKNLTAADYAENWLIRVSKEKDSLQTQKNFLKITGLVASKTLDKEQLEFEELANSKAQPITRFSLKSFSKRLRLTQRVRLRSVRKHNKSYNEDNFSNALDLLDDSLSKNPSAKGKAFIEKFNNIPKFDFTLQQVQEDTIFRKGLPISHPRKPKAGSKWVKERLNTSLADARRRNFASRFKFKTQKSFLPLFSPVLEPFKTTSPSPTRCPQPTSAPLPSGKEKVRLKEEKRKRNFQVPTVSKPTTQRSASNSKEKATMAFMRRIHERNQKKETLSSDRKGKSDFAKKFLLGKGSQRDFCVDFLTRHKIKLFL